MPLSYVVWPNLNAPHSNEDPAWGQPASQYTTIDKELEACAPIVIKDFYVDVTDDEAEKSGPLKKSNMVMVKVTCLSL